MGFQRRIPQGDPSYFCGRIPCPLCFVYGEDDGNTVDVEVYIIRQEYGREPIEGEAQVLKDELTQNIHEAAKLLSHEPASDPPTADQLVDAYDEATSRRRLEIEVEATLNAAMEERARQRPAKPKVLDHLDETYLEELNKDAEKSQKAKEREEDKKRKAREYAAAYGNFAGLLSPPERGDRQTRTIRLRAGSLNILVGNTPEKRAAQEAACEELAYADSQGMFRDQSRVYIQSFYESRYDVNYRQIMNSLKNEGLEKPGPITDDYKDAKARIKAEREKEYAQQRENYYVGIDPAKPGGF